MGGVQKWICLRLSESRLGGLALCTGGKEVRAGIGLLSNNLANWQLWMSVSQGSSRLPLVGVIEITGGTECSELGDLSWKETEPGRTSEVRGAGI